MLNRGIYYALKPYLPWRLRIALRRILAGRILKRCQTTWPIDESTGTPPPGWSGWPNNHRFSFVITHDVEDQDGVEKCRQLAQLEMDLGFRSSFNFIPEGNYQVTKELRDWLTSNGFEVGVHDLHHDGKLFSSESGFSVKAQRINTYLKDWNAKGYRSGFMLRNLDWLHQLNIGYDASTFDTDPFEPQPDGAGTIFPFWIPKPSRTSSHESAETTSTRHPPLTETSRDGYVELPYTLVQDSTLFLILGEKTPQIWINKTAWIASKGGMALVNVHPDYVGFNPSKLAPKEFPASAYADFLRSIKRTYGGQYWNPLPHELASWYRLNHVISVGSKPPFAQKQSNKNRPSQDGSSLVGKKAAVLLYSTYPADPRPRRAAEAMISAGMTVDLLCLAHSSAEKTREVVNHVEVTRIRLTHRRESKIRYIWQYGRFCISAFWFLTTNCFRKRYDVIHVHNMPDFLVFAAFVPRILGSKVILDLHDPMPELMESIYNLSKTSLPVTALRMLERASIFFSSLVITPNISFKNLFVGRGCPARKIHIIMNSPQADVFRLQPRD